ncbi:MAG TPA: type II secretion system protein [Mollicutes bacterium]|nr:type II secretion system protein [Mollicutes bacterium]
MKKGFTLVELLAVIVILAVILAIAVPGISNMIDNSKRSAFDSNAKLVLKGIEFKRLEDDGFNPLDINETNINSLLNRCVKL